MKNSRKEIIAMEKRFGSVNLLKMCVSGLGRVLVKNGCCTKKQLRKAFDKELEKAKAMK
jgi:hypothetical protein